MKVFKQGHNKFIDSTPQDTDTQSKSSISSFQIESASPSGKTNDSFSLQSGVSIFQSVLAMLAATLGSVVLIISNSMAASGVAWSVIQMILCAIISYFSLITVLKCANHINVFSYQDLALNTYGHWCRQLVNVFSFCGNWGSMILYLKLIVELFAMTFGIFFGHNAPSWLINGDSKVLIIVVATIFVYPLAFSKNLKALSHFTLVNLFIVLFFCFVMIVEKDINIPFKQSLKSVQMFIFKGFTTTFPSAIFAYMSHANVLDVYKELEKPTINRMKIVIRLTILIVLVGYVFIGLLGYATFANNLGVLVDPEKSNGVILLAYGYDLHGKRRSFPFLVIVSMVTMAISIVISQPFNLGPAKNSLRNFLRPISNASRDKTPETNLERFIYSTISLYSGVYVVINFQSIQAMMNIVGSAFFPVICFILPSMFHLRIFHDDSKNSKMVHKAMIIFNIIFTILNTIGNIKENIDNFE